MPYEIEDLVSLGAIGCQYFPATRKRQLEIQREIPKSGPSFGKSRPEQSPTDTALMNPASVDRRVRNSTVRVPFCYDTSKSERTIRLFSLSARTMNKTKGNGFRQKTFVLSHSLAGSLLAGKSSGLIGFSNFQDSR